MTIERHAPALPAQAGTGYDLIRTTALAMADANAIAKAVANTDMVPKHFRGKPDDLTAAILYGATLGFDPMQSARQVYVIHGQAALYARAMAALVLSAGHEVWTEASTPDAVTVAGRRRGSDRIERATWDAARAKRAEYTSNAKYRTNPEEMLYAKAVSEVCRKIAPDVLNGVYAYEEMQLERVESERVDQPRGIDALLARTPDPSPAPEADAAAPVVSGHDDASAGEGPTAAQLRKMGALLKEVGLPEREAALAYVGDVVGRAVTSRNELSKDEAGQVIDALEADRDQEPGGAA